MPRGLFNVLKPFLILQCLLSIAYMMTKRFGIWTTPYTDLRRQKLYLNKIGQLTPSYVNQRLIVPNFMPLGTLLSVFAIMVVL